MIKSNALLIALTLLISGCNGPSENPGTDPVQRVDILDPAVIGEFHMDRMRADILPLFERAGHEPASVFEEDLKRYATADRIRYYGRGTDVVRAAYLLSSEPGRSELKEFAIAYADFLIERFSEPEGHFVEYEKCPWLTPETLWYTIPWGTAFHGNDMVDTYRLIKDDLNAEQRFRWNGYLERTGEWLHGNPVIGTYVFNCTMDLCRLLWRIGNELDREDWKEWGMSKAHELIERDIDEAGWIHGESKGVSPGYQLLGTDFISRFAWESDDPVLKETSAKCFALHVRFASPTLFWNGNFGTRSNYMDHIARRQTTLIQAAFGNETAAWFLHRYGHPSWSADQDIWEAALNTTVEAPVYEAIEVFPGIESRSIREGIFQAWFTDYEKSLWARGFVGLWSSVNDDALFSTLHSLPSRVEKAKLRLDNTSDWAGFPHVNVLGDGETYYSHQMLGQLTVVEDEGLRVTWTENLLSHAGASREDMPQTPNLILENDAGPKRLGGVMKNEYHFQDSMIEMKISLTELKGPVQLDFHLMRRTDQYFALWEGEDMEKIKAGNLPFRNSERTIEWLSGERDEIIFQLNNNLYLFGLKKIPAGSRLTAGMLQDSGLHTRNHGGVRLRIDAPQSGSEMDFEIAFTVIGRRL